MLAATASVMTHAMSLPTSANAWRTAAVSLYGRTIVSAAIEGVTPGESGSRMWRREPAAASSESP